MSVSPGLCWEQALPQGALALPNECAGAGAHLGTQLQKSQCCPNHTRWNLMPTPDWTTNTAAQAVNHLQERHKVRLR